jgi:hypothetical protein
MHPEVRQALKVLRRHSKNAKARANRRLEGRRDLITFRQAHFYDTQAFATGALIRNLAVAFERMAQLDKDAKKEQEALRQLPKDKTAGRNFLRPELGR